MQINLKQTEIETALRDYVSKLGINLQNRAVSIQFTSGRQGRGLMADLNIPDIDDLPDFPEDETAIPASPVNRSSHLQAVDSVALSQDVAAETEEIKEVEDTPAFDVAKPSTTSLFGG